MATTIFSRNIARRTTGVVRHRDLSSGSAGTVPVTYGTGVIDTSSPTATPLSELWRRNLHGEDEAKLTGKRNEKWWFTGTLPQETPGFDGKYLRSLAQPRLDQVTRQGALAYFQNTWGLYETLFASLQGEEAFYRPPQHGLRHPMQFYYGHPAVLYINKAVVAGLIDKPIEPSFESQFEIGVDEMRWDDMTLGDKAWPMVSQVTEYRREVYRQVVDLVNRNLDSTPRAITWDHPMWSFFMACEHDRIHLETSSVLIRELPLNLVRKPEFFPEPFTKHSKPSSYTPQNELVAVNGRVVKMGKDRSFPSYGWDNEYGHSEVKVGDFQASRHLATNGEFLEFVKSGGYRERRFWSEDGWGWRRFRNAQHPFFWVRNGPAGSHKYLLRYPFEIGEFQLSLPAVVNLHEAKAFCNWKAEQRPEWKGMRLTTEAEHQLLLDKQVRVSDVRPTSDPALLAGGNEYDSKYHINSNLAYGSERPVDLHGPNTQGFTDSMGNVWQWCEDEITPLPGFETHPYYGDFSEPCFDGKHNVIKGGSFISTGDSGANAHCRYHFRPHFLQHSGFRYVVPSQQETRPGDSGGAAFLSKLKAEEKTSSKQQTQADYESSKMVAQYLALHFGSESPLIPHENSPVHALNFPRRCARLLSESFARYGDKSGSSLGARALDIGCAVGGSTFHSAALGRFNEVVGLDYSKAFVEAADRMKQQGKMLIDMEDGSKENKFEVAMSSDEMRHRNKTSFVVGDACALDVKALGQFDAVLGANLLCRLPDPHACLNAMPKIVKRGGIVVFVSPFSWMTSFTPSDRWLGPVGNSEKELVAEMKSLGFRLCEELDVPLIIRDHRRKYQYIVSHGAVFKNHD